MRSRDGVRGASVCCSALTHPLSCTLCSCHPPSHTHTIKPSGIYNISSGKTRFERRYLTDNSRNILLVTVATHREPYIELLEQSARRMALKLHVLGMGEFFKGLYAAYIHYTCLHAMPTILLLLFSYRLPMIPCSLFLLRCFAFTF